MTGGPGLNDSITILVIGDIVGSPGRDLIERRLKELVERHAVDFVIANGENASGGKSLMPKNASELLSHGVDIITSGNHIWHNRKILEIIDIEPRLLRPANYPDGAPGKGYVIMRVRDFRVCVINLIGRVELAIVDCPFRKFDAIYREVREKSDVIIVDFHAEATSEKRALGWYTDGRASAIYGTHTHVQTADEEILTKGTGYISDIGMTGPFNSVIGVDKDKSIMNFITQVRHPFDVASGNEKINGAVFKINRSGKTTSILRINE